MVFSDHVIYVDESGDHGLTPIDPDYPIFGLRFCMERARAFLKERGQDERQTAVIVERHDKREDDDLEPALKETGSEDTPEARTQPGTTPVRGRDVGCTALNLQSHGRLRTWMGRFGPC